MLTSTQIENTRLAYAIMLATPAHKIELNVVRDGRKPREDADVLNPLCGSAGCIAGVLSAYPQFQVQGLRWKGTDLEKVDHIYGLDLDFKLFGSPFIFDGGHSGIHGKREALERLRLHMEQNSMLTSEENAKMRKVAQELTE